MLFKLLKDPPKREKLNGSPLNQRVLVRGVYDQRLVNAADLFALIVPLLEQGEVLVRNIVDGRTDNLCLSEILQGLVVVAGFVKPHSLLE